MNARDILFYGDRTLHGTLARVPPSEWEREGVCGWWSVKNIVAHLVSFELVLVDVLRNQIDGSDMPYLALYRDPGFNDKEVAKRQDKNAADTLAEYEETHAIVMGLIEKLTPEKLREVGTIPWYGDAYSLDDLLVYTQYGHKREHSAQVAVFADVVDAEKG